MKMRNKPCPICRSSKTRSEPFWNGSQFILKTECFNLKCISNNLNDGNRNKN